ncbi:hypothetical protein PRZ48_008010 [Zasmidium cellare]|uniref:Uncharacterized protein n=1 Tax=Zasmidium cellare TaxID=395010 RepID=A0ABR0EE94_ZASCE|nr:hypothetical protein PRZ48_008010 [Zasmidium cellare]
MAQDLGIDASPTKLKHQLLASALPLDSDLVDDCLKWYRLCLADAILAGKGRQGEQRHMVGETLAGTVDVFKKLLESDGIPSGHVLAYHSLLCQAHKLEYMLRVKEDWKNLENLSRVIDDHNEACEWQRRSLKATISTLRPEEALVVTQLVDMQLHTAYCWVSGSATFYAVMAGAQTRDSSTDIDAKQALDVSDQIIERFAESTGHKHASEPHTEFLIKYGSSRMDDLELALLNHVSTMDNLSLEGVSLHRLLSEWKEWNVLGQVKVSMPVEMKDKDEQNSLGLEGFEVIPDDLFFDWDLWLREENLTIQ